MHRSLVAIVLLMGCREADDSGDTAAWAQRRLVPSRGPSPTRNSWMPAVVVALPADLPSAATPIPIEHVRWRTGFRPVQTTCSASRITSTPHPSNDRQHRQCAGSVQIWDLTTGTRLPCWAELDARPEDNPAPVLLVRPAVPFPVDHRIAVVIGTDVRTTDGAALPVEPWYDSLMSGVEPWSDSRAGPATTRTSMQRSRPWARRLGPWRSTFPSATRPLRSATWPNKVGIPPSHVFDTVLDADEHDLPPQTWRRLQGTFPVDDWLLDDAHFVLDDAGLLPFREPPRRSSTSTCPRASRTPTPARSRSGCSDTASSRAPQRTWLRRRPIWGAGPADWAGAIVVATTWRDSRRATC